MFVFQKQITIANSTMLGPEL